MAAWTAISGAREKIGRHVERFVLVGRSHVRKVHECDLDGFGLSQLLPAYNPLAAYYHPHWIPHGTSDAAGHARLSVHTWLVRHEGLTLLIDTGAGNDKDRPGLEVLHRLQHPYLARLAEAGMTVDAVDYVLLTHLHADHVGWNTRRADGAWAPTFPNATVICSDREWRYGAALSRGDEADVARVREEAALGQPIRIPTAGVFDDSLRPLEAADRLKRIDIDGSEVLPGIRFIATPGHSIDHAAIEIVSEGEVALFGGDVLHHPLEDFRSGAGVNVLRVPLGGPTFAARPACARREEPHCVFQQPLSSQFGRTRQPGWPRLWLVVLEPVNAALWRFHIGIYFHTGNSKD